MLLADCDVAAADVAALAARDAGDRAAVRECLAYLRERVGVPRDMSYPAARCLRATLNWVSDALE